MQLAAVAEAAALAGIPTEPSAYGLPSAASRRLPPTRDIFTPPAGRLREAAPTSTRRSASPEPDSDEQNDRDDEVAVWNTP
jgi:hypothetical protein